ncbi:MAG: glycosyltransferase family 2 protein [Planctomycetota bacterium]|nr:glycosyltransferase family 2 protein [Planctomycetota bacterium]
MSNVRISIALCTYNGRQFLGEQLESIAAQSRLPDELVVRDDGSTDRTVSILQEFAATVRFPVRVKVNSQNLGSTANFDRCLSDCTGDIIVLADQDDWWCPNKLSRLEEELAIAPEAAFVFSNAEVVDNERRPIGYSLWDSVAFRAHEQQELMASDGFQYLLRRYAVTGATLAFRSQYRSLISPIPRSWVHDTWIALLLRAVAPCRMIDEKLIEYRQHSNQQIGACKRGIIEQYRYARRIPPEEFRRVHENYAAAARRLRDQTFFEVSDLVHAEMDAKVEHATARRRIREGQPRLPIILREVFAGRYGRYDHGWKSIACDLLLGSDTPRDTRTSPEILA